MSTRAAGARARVWWWRALGLLLVAAISVALRWPGFTRGGFVSHDVGAILHSGMLLRAGGLPYVDTFELKAPGTFFLATWLAGPDARDISLFQRWANTWGVLSLLTVGGIAWRSWGGRAAVVAAGLYAVHDAFLDSMDGNYVTWAQLPMLLAVLVALTTVYLPRGPGRARLARALGWTLAGALAGLAAQCKRPVGLVYGWIALRALLDPYPCLESGGARERGALRIFGVSLYPVPAALTALGLALSFLPLVVFYASRGQLDALLRGYVFNEIGLDYISRRASAGLLHTAREGVLATTHFLALPLALAAWTLGAPRVRGARATPATREASWLWLWLLFTLAAASLGGRFYKGYFLAVAPPLCVLAAAPWGLLGREWSRGRVGRDARRRAWARALAAPLMIFLLARASLLLDGERKSRARAHDRGGRIIGEHVARNTSPGDRVWFWGWHLWDSYAYSGRLCASRIHKPLGLLTPINDDTWRTPATRLRLAKDSPYLDILIDELERARPVYIVLGSTVPRQEFSELRALLRRDYVIDRRVTLGRVQFWERRDRAAARRGAARRQAPGSSG
ncbi:MAG: hypothetical protein H6713_31050 [Myxococcales bacterium]|nr:hypothetical protein [Myxococcales bacterium]